MNQDDKCFQYLISVVFIKPRKTIRIFFQYKIENAFKFEGINFPGNKNDIDKFEEITDNAGVHVFEVDDEIWDVVKKTNFQKQTCQMSY